MTDRKESDAETSAKQATPAPEPPPKVVTRPPTTGNRGTFSQDRADKKITRL